MAIDAERNALLIELLVELLIETALLEKQSNEHFTAEDVYGNTS